ncbi:MAG TPA: efflux RND transporter periplasmic adaptor subunit [Vicinamibacteria bacterium]|nr:efflux RND transporter periplasmic adaptor subunit [Vicinamibacteria bacterium]
MRWPRRRTLLALVALVVVALVVAVVLSRRDGAPKYATAAVDRGDIVETVGATGTLQAVTTVQVGSQVSGTIQSLGADFNTTVKKGQVIARLDPSSFEARVGQAKANLVSARANVERARTAVVDGQQKYERAKELATEQLLPQSDLETAKANYDSAVAQLKANEAAVSQADASVNQAQVDLDHTVITTPIDGVVINRAVDVGQTVAASFQAPVLFIIANDLTHMQVNAAVDEADIGRVKAGEDVSFRVDAYPDRSFAGRVEQVRLQPQTIQNVVSYNTIISVDNAEQKLMPGMTATVSVIVRKAENVLRLPASALRFRPEGFQGERQRGGRPAGAGAAGSPAVQAADRAGADRGGPDRAGASGRAPRGAAPESRGDGAAGEGGEKRRSLVFTMGDEGKPEPARVQVGLSDGQFAEVKDGLVEGALVVTGLQSATPRRPGSPTAGPSPSNNPFAPGPPARRQR